MIQGSKFALHIVNGKEYSAVAGGRLMRMVIDSQPIFTSQINKEGWQKVIDSAGYSKISITFDGVFHNDHSSALIMELTLTRAAKSYMMTMGDGRKIFGDFVISKYERDAELDDFQNYHITLENSGPIIVQQPP